MVLGCLAEGMQGKEMSLFTRIEPLPYIESNFNLTGHKRLLNFYIAVQKIGMFNTSSLKSKDNNYFYQNHLYVHDYFLIL